MDDPIGKESPKRDIVFVCIRDSFGFKTKEEQDEGIDKGSLHVHIDNDVIKQANRDEEVPNQIELSVWSEIESVLLLWIELPLGPTHDLPHSDLSQLLYAILSIKF